MYVVTLEYMNTSTQFAFYTNLWANMSKMNLKRFCFFARSSFRYTCLLVTFDSKMFSVFTQSNIVVFRTPYHLSIGNNNLIQENIPIIVSIFYLLPFVDKCEIFNIHSKCSEAITSYSIMDKSCDKFL